MTANPYRAMRVAPVYRDLCCVAPAPEVAEDMARQAARLAEEMGVGGFSVRVMAARPDERHIPPGFNDGTIYPPDYIAEVSAEMRVAPDSARLARRVAPSPPRGEINVLVLLVDFDDNRFQDADALRDTLQTMLFSEGTLDTGSLNDFYREVSGNKVWFQGVVAGPYRAPQPYTFYTNNQSGTGPYPNNTPRLVEDLVALADPDVDFAQFDPNGDGFVDGLIVVHAGPGAEAIADATRRRNAIWSHKWTTRTVQRRDSTNIYAYLTVPEESNIGVWAHELGHLIFGWPDLYDIDNSSEGIGNFCLMAGGSWNARGKRPAHPSAWCKAKQGWVSVHTPTRDGDITLQPVEVSPEVYRLWTRGQPGQEYFLIENRQKIGFDDNLPDTGLAIYHIDDTQQDNSQERHYMVGLEQADGRDDLENGRNRGDDTDLWPEGATVTFDANSTPNSNAYNGALTFVSVSNIVQSGLNISATISVGQSQPPGEDGEGGAQPGTCLETLLSIVRALFGQGGGR
ncbi:MAG: hypothetical protein Kow00120_23420 [Anaerolineae bacterium]